VTDVAILDFLHSRFDHVSAERVLSGPGLVNLHEALSHIRGAAYQQLDAHAITDLARRDPASLCRDAFDRFCRILGSFCGDVALVMGAREGVLVAGGILPATADILAAAAFREAFESKGRFRDYMKAIPTRLILQPYAGLLGAAALLVQRFGASQGNAAA
jgi:glucokinase